MQNFNAFDDNLNKKIIQSPTWEEYSALSKRVDLLSNSISTLQESISSLPYIRIIEMFGGRSTINITKPNSIFILSNSAYDESMSFQLYNETETNLHFGIFTIDTINSDVTFTIGFGDGTLNSGSYSKNMSGGTKGFKPDDLIFIITHGE